MLPKIAAYHARIGVRMADGIAVIEASVPDWMSDKEVFSRLGRSSTLGDLVFALRSGVNSWRGFLFMIRL